MRAPAVAVAAALAAGSAQAQSSTRTIESTPFVVHAVAADVTERVAKPGEPLLVHPATSVRAARLTAEAPTTSGYKKVKSFPAGTAMFGAHAPGGWVYCAVAASTARWWAGDEFACYEDADEDGRFESVRLSGEPFMRVPLFVFQLGAAKALPTPVPYERVPYAEGPRIDYALSFKVDRPRGKRGEPPPAATSIRLTAQVGQPGAYASIGDGIAGARLTAGQTATLQYGGAKIDILGVEADGSVRYRVTQGMPTHIERVVMGVTTTTTYTPIFVPG